MSPFAVVTFAVHLVGGYFMDHPDMLLPLRGVQRPGESRTAFTVREFNRLCAIVTRMDDVNRRQAGADDSDTRRWEDKLLTYLVDNARRDDAAQALRVVAGGIADHPKASYTRELTAAKVELAGHRMEFELRQMEKFIQMMHEYEESHWKMVKSHQRTQAVLKELEAEIAKRQKR